MQRKFLVCGIAILAAFSIGLIGFFAVSEGKPDGLETVLEGQGVQESAPVWTAPLDYGSDFFSALFMGMIGFGLVLTITFGYLKVAAKKKRQGIK
jgi:hypothetical protein